MYDEDACPCRKTRPVSIGIAKYFWDSGGIRGDVRCSDVLLSQDLCADRLVRPINVGLWIVLLRDKPVHRASALGFLRVIDRADPDPRVFFEIVEDRLRKDLIVADIHDHGRRAREGIEVPRGGNSGGKEPQ